MNEPTQKRIFFLINPHSGGRQAINAIRDLKQYAQNQANYIQIEEIIREQLADQIAKASTADIIVIGGGDGTLSTLLPMLSGCKSKIGILPLGTGNDLASELKLIGEIPLNDTYRLIEFYRTAPSREVTYFILEYGNHFSYSTNFINYVSFGFDAKVVSEFARLRETKIWRSFRGVWANRIGYAAMCVRHFNHCLKFAPALAMKYNDRSLSLTEATSIFFSNIRSVMGLGISNPSSSAFDDQVECLVVNNLLHYLAMLSHYKLPILQPKFVGSARTWEMRGFPSDVHVQIDGEPRPDITSENYRISPGGKIPIIVGPNCQ